MGIHWAEQSIEIAAPPETVFDAITDYESFAEWQDAVKATEVIDRYEDGLGRRVRVTVDARIRTVTYVLHYHYERPRRIWWDLVESSAIEAIEGEYVFEPDGSGTRATYRLGIDPGVPVPGFLARRLNQGVMRGSVKDLRDEAERRAAES
jgi:uncharacterized protein YndB with AHSA1/START domain